MLRSNSTMSLSDTFKQLNKARERISQYLEDGDIQEVIKQLKIIRGFKVDEKLLRTTKIGVFVNSLKQKSNKPLADLAKDVILKWKNDIAQGNSSNQPSDRSEMAPVNRVPILRPVDSIRKPPSRSNSTSTPAPRVRPKERTPQGDGITLTFDDAAREKMVIVLYSALALGNTIDGHKLLPFAIEIEDTIFKNCDGTTEAYRKRIGSLNFNLRDPKNPELNDRVLSKTLSVSELCSMSPEALASESKKKEVEDLRKLSLFKAQAASSGEAETDMFRCGKCKQRKCTYFQKQIRSADEPMTTFVTCVNCDNHWKFC